MPPLKLVAVDIDGTLLNSQFRVSEAKGFGWAMTRCNDEDGVAHALELTPRAEVEA